MVEKIFDKMEGIQNINQAAAQLKQMGLKEELEKLAAQNGISKNILESFMAGKRYFLVDGGSTAKTYISARSKLMDEMLYLKDPVFADIVGNHLLKQCNTSLLNQQILQRHKTLQRCIDYLMEQAWELVDSEAKQQRTQAGLAVADDTVFCWIRDYYGLDDAQQVAEKEKEAEVKFIRQRKAVTEVKKPADSRKKHTQTKKKTAEAKKEDGNKTQQAEKQEDRQLSLFDAGMEVQGA